MRFASLLTFALLALHVTGALQRGSIESYAWTAVAAAIIGGYVTHRAHITTNRSRTELVDSRNLSTARAREALFS